MRVILNGAPTNIDDGATVDALLAAQALPRERVAVEVNGALVRRAARATQMLAEGDTVEVVTLVGGG